MKQMTRIFAAMLCAATLPLGFAACGGTTPSAPQIEVSVSDDGYLIVNGTKTEIKSGENGKSAYELYRDAHPDYRGSEAQWLDDLVTGKLATKREYVLVSYGKNYDADLVTGTAIASGGALKLNDAVLALNASVVLPIGSDASWELEFDGVLMPNGAGGGQFLNSNGHAVDGRVYFGCNAGNNAVFLGVNIGGTYFNYCWSVPAAAMRAEHTYRFRYRNGAYLLAIDDGEEAELESVNVSQANVTAVEDPAIASRELSQKIRAVTGQDYVTMTHVGAVSHKCGCDIVGLRAETSSIYDYEALTSHPLREKNIFYLGSSVTRGRGGNTDGSSFVEQIAALTGNRYRKEAISGTTLAVRQGLTDSYCERLNLLPLEAEPDALVVQLSTNDFTNGVPLGTVGTGRDADSFNTATLTGAIEWIAARVKETSPETKVIFYTCPLGTSWAKYAEYRNYANGAFQKVAAKWDIEIVNLFHAENVPIPACYMQPDNLHPTAEGFASVFTPALIDALMRISI